MRTFLNRLVLGMFQLALSGLGAALLSISVLIQGGHAAHGPGWNAGPPWAARAQTPHPAVARIVVPEGNATSYGSGTLVDARDEYGLVITNWHVVRDARDKIEVVFPGGFSSLARAVKLDQNWDLAALVIWRPPVEPVRLAAKAPNRGDLLSIAGYGQGSYRIVSGRCTQYLAPAANFPQELVEISVEARQGDSGGPILNERGELAGVLFGAGHGTTLGSYAGRVGDFLANVIPAANAVDSQASQALAAGETPPIQTGEGTRAEFTSSAPPELGDLVPVPRSTGDAWATTAPPPLAGEPPVTGNIDWMPRAQPLSQASNEIVLEDRLPPRHAAASLIPPADLPPAPAIAAIATEPIPTGSQPQTHTITWSDIAGESMFEQAKTVLAGLGVLSVLFVLLRNR